MTQFMGKQAQTSAHELVNSLRVAFDTGNDADLRRAMSRVQAPNALAGLQGWDRAAAHSLIGEAAKCLVFGRQA